MSIAKKKKEIYLIAQNIRSLYNVGSLFRTCDAFGVKKIYLCGYTGTPPRNQITKTALGAEKAVEWEKCRQTLSLIKKLKKQGVNIIALETTKKSHSLNKFKPKFPLALVIGNEVEGIKKNVLNQADQIVKIPMQGMKSSLNVSVATGVALYQLNKFDNKKDSQIDLS